MPRDPLNSFKLSRYVISSQHPFDKNYLSLFNTKNNAFILIDKKSFYHEDFSNSEFRTLVKMDFLVPKNIDEFNEYLKYAKKFIDDKSLFTIVLFTTLKCNLNCIYCFQNNKSITSDLSKETILRIINHTFNYVKSQNIKKINTTFIGGEPTLKPDIIRFYIKNFHLLNNSSFDYSCNLVTNGVVLDEKLVNDLIEFHLGNINVTIDGPPKIHNTRRYSQKHKKTYENIISNINLFSSKVNFSINVIIDEGNFFELENFIKTISKELKNKNSIKFSFYLNHFAHKSLDILQKDHHILVNTFLELKKSGFNMHLPFRMVPCIYYRKNAIIYDTQGLKHKCYNDAHVLLERNIFENTPKQIFVNKCHLCKYIYVCNGSCIYLKAIYENEELIYCQKQEIEFFMKAFIKAKIIDYEKT